MSGTIDLKTERLTLRKHVLKDAEVLHERFGLNPKMYEYSGWNPYKTPEIALNSVKSFIDDYSKEHFYAWAIEENGNLVGTIGAYDYDDDDNSIEIGMSIAEEFWGRGFASEALKCVIDFLTKTEGISVVKGWCAADNVGSRKVLEKSGMKQVSVEVNALKVEDKTFDQLNYEFIS